MKKQIVINLVSAYIPFHTADNLFTFKTRIAEEMSWAEFEKLDENLSLASDDYIRADYATYEDDENGETVAVCGVDVVAYYANPAQIFGAVDVLESFGYRVYVDDVFKLVDEPDANLPYCYWEE